MLKTKWFGNISKAVGVFCLMYSLLLPTLKAQKENALLPNTLHKTTGIKPAGIPQAKWFELFVTYKSTECEEFGLQIHPKPLPHEYSRTMLPWWEPAPNFHLKRFLGLTGVGFAAYATLSAGLWKIWYSQYPLNSFHFFNDAKEWLQVDKAGHLYSAYNSSRTTFYALRWTGLNRKKAAWTAIGTGLGFLTTIEIMDGFSEKWGFSPADMGANLLGSALFLSQELAWKEQRILVKVSSSHPPYSTAPLYAENGQGISSLQRRAAQLYGTGFFERLFKDYNAQTNWLSFNLASFTGDNRPDWLPPWLNLALGYGADNMFGGFDNRWTEEGEVFQTDLTRYRQYYLSFDIDFTRLPGHDKPWIRGLYQLLNLFKMPSPTLEFNSLGTLKMHWLFF